MDKKQALKSAAYEVFSKKGYKATGISEIARQAHVAVGSFYNYYESKEAIFLDIYIDENNRVRQTMIEELDWEIDMIDLISQLFAQSRALVSSNKILAEWYNPAIADELHSYYSSEEGKVTNPFHPLLIVCRLKAILQKKFKIFYKFTTYFTTWICISQKMIFQILAKL